MPRRLLLFVCGTLAVAAMMLTQQDPVKAANPAADLDQCRNGDQANPVPCTGGAWVNGNAGASNAHWLEGDSIAYRMRFSSLATGTSNPHTLIIEWDTTQGGKHAIDYITSVDRSVAADPCSGVPGCTPTNALTIPADPNVTGAGLGTAPLAGRWNQEMRLYNAGTGTIQSIAAYSLSGSYTGNSSTLVTITFTTTTPNPVLAWGGHIATRADWGTNNSAIAISGSPYHMRLVSLDGSGGNQDRSLSSAAAIFPAMLTVIKDVQTTNGGAATSNDPFVFNATGPNVPGTNTAEVPSPFTLVDDGTQNPETTPNSSTYSLQLFGSNNAVTVAETAYSAYTQSLSCTEVSGGLGVTLNTTVTQGTRTANVIAEEGEVITCTYVNKIKAATLTVIKTVVNDNGGTKTAADFTIHVKTSVNGQLADVTDSPKAGSASGNAYTLPAATYVVSENDPTSIGYSQTSFSGDCDLSGNVTLAAGESKSCTITNNDVAPVLHLRKIVTNDNGGQKGVADFTLTANGTGSNDLSGTSPVDSGSTLQADTWALSETSVTGYTASAWVCTGGTQNGSNITLKVGEEATCTITNDDSAQANDPHTTPASSVTLNDSANIKKIREVSGTTYKVVFRLYRNDPAAQTAVCDSNTKIFTATRDLTLSTNAQDSSLKDGAGSTTGQPSANTTDSPANGNIVNQSGKYYWTVTMASDANNAGVTESCGSELTNLTISNTGN